MRYAKKLKAIIKHISVPDGEVFNIFHTKGNKQRWETKQNRILKFLIQAM